MKNTIGECEDGSEQRYIAREQAIIRVYSHTSLERGLGCLDMARKNEAGGSILFVQKCTAICICGYAFYFVASLSMADVYVVCLKACCPFWVYINFGSP